MEQAKWALKGSQNYPHHDSPFVQMKDCKDFGAGSLCGWGTTVIFLVVSLVGDNRDLSLVVPLFVISLHFRGSDA